MKINDIFTKLIMEASEYKYGCIMLELDVPKEFWSEIQDKIEEDDIDKEEGLVLLSDVHVTILYGLHTDVKDSEINDYIDKMVNPELILKKISIFENDNYDVLKFDVYGEDLHRMNKMFSELPHTTTFKDYHPHVTIGYLKKGTGKKYIETLKDDKILKIKPNKIIYSKANGETINYKFKSKKND